MEVKKINHFVVQGDYNEYNNGLDKDSLENFFFSLKISLENEKNEERKRKILQEAWTFIRDTASSVLSQAIASKLLP